MCPRTHLRIATAVLGHVLLWFGSIASATAADLAASSTLHLTNGGFIRGELRNAEDPRVLRWRSPHFAKPIDFALSGVNAVHYIAAGPQPKPVGEYCFELVDDDVLFGNLAGLTDEEVVMDSPRTGRLSLRREQIRRIYRWNGADSIYLGPNGLAGWKDASVTPLWRDEGGQLLTDRPGASLFADLALPDRAVLEFEISWKQKPDFVLALGVDEKDVAGGRAFHFEVWDGDLVAVAESPRSADVASIQQIGAGEGHVRVQAYLDQTQGRLLVLSRGGKPLATLRIDAKKSQVRSGLRLTNKKGDVRLEYLRITGWNGAPPSEGRGDQSRVHRTDGSIVYGRVTAFDPKTKQFTLRDGTKEVQLKQDEIADLFLSLPGKPPAGAATGAADRPIRLVYRDGSRFSGVLTRVEDTHLTLSFPATKGPLRLPVTELRSLVSLRREPGAEPQAVGGRAGRLELDGVSLKGRLASGVEQKDASCLVWQPDLARSASPLIHGASGRVFYRDAPPPSQSRATVPGAQRDRILVEGFARVAEVRVQLDGNVPVGETALRPPSSGKRSLHLRTGDTIPCEVTSIDDKGIGLKTTISNATFVPHEKIKVVELTESHNGSPLSEAKVGRLLTLPRLLKNSPPTHLICSKNGDVLRGRVLEMNDTRLKVEVRLETKEIPRDRVAQIIWLHADELGDGKATAAAANAARAHRVQIVQRDGNRLTFVAQKMESDPVGDILSGTSDILGTCRADLAEVDQLLFGAYIDQSAAKLAYHAWKLHYAAEPKFAQDEGGASADGRASGTESPLVGQPAFPFRLDLLDGGKFNLAEHKGRVVVLDFWATWCGPCLQAMPAIDGVVREFADKGVELFAVNMEEQPAQIKAVLERHKLKVPVVLDRDGGVATRYAVTAIPQTVVIDREGKVVRLFVGGGKATADGLRKALQDLTVKPAPMP